MGPAVAASCAVTYGRVAWPPRRHAVSAATLNVLARDCKIETSVVQKAIKYLGIYPEKPNPAFS